MGAFGLERYETEDFLAFLSRSGYLNEHDFWSSLSGLSKGTTFDHMREYLTNEGYTGSPHDQFRQFLHAQTSLGGALRDMAREFYQGTFSVGGGEITFQNSTQASSGSSDTTISVTHSLLSGTNRLIVIGFNSEINSTVTDVTYDGTSLREVGEQDVDAGTSSLWYALEADLPGSAGDYTVTVTISEAVTERHIRAMQFQGVKQQAPEATDLTENVTSAQTLNSDITTLTDGALVVDSIHVGQPTNMTADDGQTVPSGTETDKASSTGTGSYMIVVSAGLTNTGWSASGSVNRIIQCLAAFAPA